MACLVREPFLTFNEVIIFHLKKKNLADHMSPIESAVFFTPGSYTTLPLKSHQDPVYRGGTSQMGMAFLSHSSPAISFLCWQTRDEHGHYEETWRICLEGFWETSRVPAFAVQVGACRKNKGMACFPSGTSTAAITDDRTSEVFISPLLTFTDHAEK